MDEKKLLYQKKENTMFSHIVASKNPMLLFRWYKHFVLSVCTHDNFLKNFVTSDESLIFPDFLLKLNQMKEFYFKTHPYHDVKYFETFRSKSRQDYLFHSGATKRHHYGMHYFCLAVDMTKWFNNSHHWNLDYDLLRRTGNSISITSLYPFEECHFQFLPVPMQNDFFDFANQSIKCLQDLFSLKIDGDIGPITQGAILFNIDRLNEYFDNLYSQIKHKIEDDKLK